MHTYIFTTKSKKTNAMKVKLAAPIFRKKNPPPLPRAFPKWATEKFSFLKNQNYQESYT